MHVRTKILVTTLVLGIVFFMLGPMAPIGSQIWTMPEEGPEPSAWQIPLFMLYTSIVCLAFGFGVSYWVFGMPWTRRLFPRLTGAAHVALGYIPASFWLHDTLHMINGENMTGLILIEYTFHVPMILVGVLLIAATIQSSRTRTQVPGYAATA